ncbi:biotin transporter BioY [Trichothermofontia sp.]
MIVTELLWALVGLILTVSGTFFEASMISPPWLWLQSDTIQTYSLGVTCQIGAVLLIACLGGKNAATLSQIAYLVLGLIWYPVFTHGGGVTYIKEPTFGYLLGFVPAAWICGFLAFQWKPRLESLAFSCLCGLASIHLIGLLYITYLRLSHSLGDNWLQIMSAYSLHPMPSQLALVCAVAVLAFSLRQVLFY